MHLIISTGKYILFYNMSWLYHRLSGVWHLTYS